ncbi:MAG: hypothetical protein ABGW97_02980 [Christiangramia sp.]|uniref:hypothetical protein n=1 Tax=Christiangramia sp. TaxID=1931228 RepID=UPI00324272C2
MKDNKIIVSPTEKKIREGWDEMIKEEIENNGQPEKLIPDVFSDEGLEEWQWKTI